VQVQNENGVPLSGMPVAFSYSTAAPYLLTSDFAWLPPPPQRAFVARTDASGQIDQIQGDVVKQGEPGGITVYLLMPEYSSDAVAGCGMLSDHTGMLLSFQLRRVGYVSIEDRLSQMEARIKALEAR
jgi:hypothetical protein